MKGNTEPMCYMYFLRHKEKTHCVDATHSGRIGRLINHCRSRPNLVTKLFVVDDVPRLGLMAKQVQFTSFFCTGVVSLHILQDLEVGVELSYDYGERDPGAMKAHPWLKA